MVFVSFCPPFVAPHVVSKVVSCTVRGRKVMMANDKKRVKLYVDPTTWSDLHWVLSELRSDLAADLTTQQLDQPEQPQSDHDNEDDEAGADDEAPGGCVVG